MSQKIDILAALTNGPLCSTTILGMFIPRGAARISDLRAEGWIVETRPCSKHSHDTRQIEYVLRNTPGRMLPAMARHARPSIFPTVEGRTW